MRGSVVPNLSFPLIFLRNNKPNLPFQKRTVYRVVLFRLVAILSSGVEGGLVPKDKVSGMACGIWCSHRIALVKKPLETLSVNVYQWSHLFTRVQHTGDRANCVYAM